MRFCHFLISLLPVTLPALAWQAEPASSASECAPAPTLAQRDQLLRYVEKRYKLPKTITLTIKKDTLVASTCFREIIFEGKGPLRTWDLTLYASPDLRFLAPDLLDTKRDPADEERANRELLMAGLTRGTAASRGSDRAQVTVAVFSDFQCAYCRKFASIMDEVLSTNAKEVRAVFHHLPLAAHSWARIAAEVTACVQLQSVPAFWSLHDQIFKNQASITVENAREQLSTLARQTEGVDKAAFQQCMQNGMSVGLVLQDMNLAEASQVVGTPTLFINGRRVLGIETADKLRELISQAGKEDGNRPTNP